MSKTRSFRSSQLISPFGPGAILDVGDESLVVMDISHWPKKLEEIKLERLTREAGVYALKRPPVVESQFGTPKPYNSLITVRFPKWMFCPKCRKLKKWRSDDEKNDSGVPVCSNPSCKKRVLVPMRFVAACQKGHLQDVPWDYWAHREAKKICDKPDLYFRSAKGKGSGLGALKICCENPGCGAESSLADILNTGALGSRCSSTQPGSQKVIPKGIVMSL
ncbi:hypothetical protein [Veronia nyctiphanis]|uniref:hypothetical protein n=1 Tax=Veronia nyctiphanis TaxID=1278244 RepID=UPI001F331D9C|nr:hypothetical protein [Veronia nyctiphanis]